MKADYVLERYGLDVDISFEEFNKKYPRCFKTTSFGREYPQVSLHVNAEDILWIDFEHDMSKIRYIERRDEFGRRYNVYQRHGIWSLFK